MPSSTRDRVTRLRLPMAVHTTVRIGPNRQLLGHELSRHFIESSSFTMLGARVRRPWRHNDQPVYQSDTLNAVVAGQEHVVVVSAPSWPSVVLMSGKSRPTRPSSSRAGTCDRFPRL